MAGSLDTWCLLWGIADALACPVLPEDLMRLPGWEATAATVRFIEEHKSWLDDERAQAELDENARKLLRVWNWENDRCLTAWTNLRLAHLGTDADSKVARLTQLRQAIGWEAYQAGAMPGPVPYWRFQRR